MNALMQNLITALRLTLLHFLWQGLAIAAGLAILLRLMHRAPANWRYLAACAALTVAATVPAITMNHLLQQSPSSLSNRAAFRPAISFASGRLAGSQNTAPPSPTFQQSTESSVRITPLLPWLVAGWAVGVLLLSSRLGFGWMRVQRLRTHNVTELAKEWQDRLGELARRLRVARQVRLLQSSVVGVPIVVGWLRPAIIFPVACASGLTPAQLEALLLHELAHIRRCDYLFNLIQSAVETLLFYHPAVWWISRRIREEREHCCDDLAAGVCGNRLVYARALATLEEIRPPGEFAMAASGTPLLKRIRRIVTSNEAPTQHPGWTLPLVLTLAAGMLLVLHVPGGRADDDSANLNRPAPASAVRPAAPDFRTNQIRVATLVEDGRILFNLGKLDEARAKFFEAREADPRSVAAYHYLEMIAERRGTDSSRKAEAKSRAETQQTESAWDAVLSNEPPDSASGDSIEASRNIVTKLNRIDVDSVHYDHLLLAEVIKDLEEKSRRNDPDHTGVKFTIGTNAEPVQTSAAAGSMARTKIGDVRIYIQPWPGEIRLSGALDLIANGADHPIRYVITSEGVEFGEGVELSARPLEAGTFATRTFHINPALLKRKLLANQTPKDMTATQFAVRKFFTDAGVDLDPLKPENKTTAIFYNDRTGTLTVHSTASDLHLIASAVEQLNRAPDAEKH